MSRNRRKKEIKADDIKISVETFLDFIKDLQLQIHTDAYSMISIKDGKRVLAYIMNTKYGIAYQERADTAWGFKTVQIKTMDEMQIKVDTIKKYLANKDKIDMSLQPTYHCQFDDCDYTVTSRKEMITHIRNSH